MPVAASPLSNHSTNANYSYSKGISLSFIVTKLAKCSLARFIGLFDIGDDW